MANCLQSLSFDSVYGKENDIGSLRIREDLSVSDESIRVHKTAGRREKKFDYEEPP
jgi:hypothetical protein